MTRERVGLQHRLHLCGQPIEAAAHVRDAERQVHADTGIERQHQVSSAAASRPSTSGPIASDTRSRRPFGSTTSNVVPD
jgi:hypothetical protein